MKEISRRDFLKVVGMVAAAVSTSRFIKSIGAEFDRFPPLTLPEATYYPFYEMHDQHFNVVKGLENKPRPAHIVFYELLLREGSSAKEFLNWEPISLMRTRISGRSEKGGDLDFGRQIPGKTLSYFYKNKIDIAYEGISIPRSFEDFSWSLDKSETAVGALSLALIGILAVAKPDFVEKREVLIGGLSAVDILWAAKGLAGNLAYNIEAGSLFAEEVKMKNIIWNANKILEDMHPENIIVFFRNLVVARKLQTLAECYKPAGKPVIAGVLGFRHMGVSDLLFIGSTVTLKLFDIYPARILKAIVDCNGGIDAFCSTLILPVRPNLQGKATRTIAFDNELRDYLIKRLS